MDFRKMHDQEAPLLLANVWDVMSARAAARSGYRAMGTSSAAMAEMLGYPDGESLSFSELMAIVVRIRQNVDLPLSVDMESGYGDSSDEVVSHLIQLAGIGVVGINLEDSKVSNGVRHLLDADAFSLRLQAIKCALKRENIPMFINARTDVFLTGEQDALQQAIVRGRAYHQAGADGFFVPCVTAAEDIRAIVSAVSLPLNVMCMPELPDFTQLAELGVKRISMGNFVHAALGRKLEHLFYALHQQGTFGEVFTDESY